jgi:hypothetical protein
MLKSIARKKHLSTIATLTTEFQTASGSNVSTRTVPQERHEMAEQPHTRITSPFVMPSVGWRGVKLAAIGLWSSGNAFSGVMNHTASSGSLTDESGFGGCQENATCPNAQCQL